MKLSKELMKQIILLMCIAAALVLAVIYSGSIIKGLQLCVEMATPLIIGCAIAFVLNIPMTGLERNWPAEWNGKRANRLKRAASILLSLILVLGVINLLIALVVPSFTETVADVVRQMPKFLKHASHEVKNFELPGIGKLSKQGAILDTLSQNWNLIVNKITGFLNTGVTNVLSSTVEIVSGVVGTLVNVVIGFVFAIYILAQKERLARQFDSLFKAYLPSRSYSYVMNVLTLLDKNFNHFITGQCLDACILGTIFVVVLAIAKIPYALMIGVVIAFTALIPVVGAFIGCVFGAFLILMAAPGKLALFLVLFIVIQQLEGNLIYPRIVGNSVELPAIWVLAAIVVGGSLFGTIGMLIFIPLSSTLYTLLREDVHRRNIIKKEN